MSWPSFRYCECRFDGHLVKLTPMETEVLSVLLIRRGEHINRYEMAEAVYTEERIDEMVDPYKIMDVIICRLRKKLPGLITSVHVTRYAYSKMRGGYMIEREQEFTPMGRPREITMAMRLAAALQQ